MPSSIRPLNVCRIGASRFRARLRLLPCAIKSTSKPRISGRVSAYGVFYATHTGQGGPCPPTGKKTKTDYVYVMQFESDKIKHMQKIWHSGLAMKELGWA